MWTSSDCIGAYMYVGLFGETRVCPLCRVSCQVHFSFTQSPSVTGYFVSTHAVTWSEQAQVNPRHRSTRCWAVYISTAHPVLRCNTVHVLTARLYRSEGQSTLYTSRSDSTARLQEVKVCTPQFVYNSVNDRLQLYILLNNWRTLSEIQKALVNFASKLAS